MVVDGIVCNREVVICIYFTVMRFLGYTVIGLCGFTVFYGYAVMRFFGYTVIGLCGFTVFCGYAVMRFLGYTVIGLCGFTVFYGYAVMRFLRSYGFTVFRRFCEMSCPGKS